MATFRVVTADEEKTITLDEMIANANGRVAWLVEWAKAAQIGQTFIGVSAIVQRIA